jgi:hypothetical protein
LLDKVIATTLSAAFFFLHERNIEKTCFFFSIPYFVWTTIFTYVVLACRYSWEIWQVGRLLSFIPIMICLRRAIYSASGTGGCIPKAIRSWLVQLVAMLVCGFHAGVFFVTQISPWYQASVIENEMLRGASSTIGSSVGEETRFEIYKKFRNRSNLD